MGSDVVANEVVVEGTLPELQGIAPEPPATAATLETLSYRTSHALAQTLPPLFRADAPTGKCVVEFFTARLRNPNTRLAYGAALKRFSEWCEAYGITHLSQVEPFHIASYLESLKSSLSLPSVKLQLSALRHLFDVLVVGQALSHNPAHSVRGPKHVVKRGKTPVLSAEETRALLSSIDPSSLKGLRDRALIALMVYTFARVGAALSMRREDVFFQGRRLWVRLHEKGGKRHEMPCHHTLEGYLDAYLDAPALPKDPKGLVFRALARGGKAFTERPLGEPDVYRMIRTRAEGIGIRTRVGCHTFRATGITEYLKNGGKLEVAQAMANHESPRTTALYDRRQDQVSLDEVERIRI